jgi:hypothetical protein
VLAPGYYTVYFVPSINRIVSLQRIDPDDRDEPGVVGDSATAPAHEIVILPNTPAPDDSSESVRG